MAGAEAKSVSALWWQPSPVLLTRWRRSPRYQPLPIVLLAVVGGIMSARFIDLETPLPWWIAAVTCWTAWLLAVRAVRLTTAGCALFLCWFALAGGWEQLRWRMFSTRDLSRYARAEDAPIWVEGTVLRAPKVTQPLRYDPLIMAKGNPRERAVRTRFPLRVTAVREGLLWQASTGRVICAIEADYSTLQPGDRVRVAGFLQLLPPALNPHEFDYAWHARADGELCQIRSDIPGAVEVLHAAPAWWPQTWLPRLRQFGSGLLHQYLNDAEAPLASAVLLGTREQLPYEQTEDFILTGTVHILSISGLHVGLLAGFLLQALRVGWLGRGTALVGVLCITTLYTLMTDSEPPAIRALAMVWVYCLAMWINRTGSIWNTYALSGLLVLALNPNDLFRTGPQLSFISMGVLSWFAALQAGSVPRDPLDRLIDRTRPWYEKLWRGALFWLVGGFLVGALIWLIGLPLVMARFYVVSWSALVINVFLAPITAAAMIAGFFILATGWWCPPAAQFAAMICDWLLGILHNATYYAARCPGSYSWTSGPSDAWLIAFYTLLLVWSVWRTYWPRYHYWGAIGLVLVLCGLAEPVIRERREPGPRCTFIAVGHGGAALIETPDRRVIVYDCGRMGSYILGERSVEAVLRSRGYRRIDTVILSHADTDHYNAVPELLRRFAVTQVLVSQRMYDELQAAENSLNATPIGGAASGVSAGLRVLAAALHEHRVALNTTWEGQTLCQAAGFNLTVLHPPIAGVPGNDNANSVVLEVARGEDRLLLTGDLEQAGVRRLLARPRTHYQVLLAPHHGSFSNSPAEIAEWARPHQVVISSSLNDDIAKTTRVYQDTGAEVFSLSRVGAVRVRWTDKGLEVLRFRVEGW